MLLQQEIKLKRLLLQISYYLHEIDFLKGDSRKALDDSIKNMDLTKTGYERIMDLITMYTDEGSLAFLNDKDKVDGDYILIDDTLDILSGLIDQCYHLTKYLED